MGAFYEGKEVPPATGAAVRAPCEQQTGWSALSQLVISVPSPLTGPPASPPVPPQQLLCQCAMEGGQPTAGHDVLGQGDFNFFHPAPLFTQEMFVQPQEYAYQTGRQTPHLLIAKHEEIYFKTILRRADNFITY